MTSPDERPRSTPPTDEPGRAADRDTADVASGGSGEDNADSPGAQPFPDRPDAPRRDPAGDLAPGADPVT